jgi:hypothetical protein
MADSSYRSRTTVALIAPSIADARFLSLLDDIERLYNGVLPPAERNRLEGTLWAKGPGSEFQWRWSSGDIGASFC